MTGIGFITSRREARLLVLQSLCEADSVRHDAGDVFARLIEESQIRENVRRFSSDLVSNVLVNRTELDSIITTYAKAWPLSQMALVDRNLLRMSIAEILWGSDAPHAAVINEAVELAKVFGSEGSPRFVNGVLGALLKSN
jgi:N utilization substance protein B